MSYLHQKAANDPHGADVCANELQVTRVALLRYRGAMAGVVRSMGVLGPTVEDVVHDAFEMACRKPEAERPDPKDDVRFLSWLCTLAKYAALTTRNDSARCREVSSPTEELEDVPELHRAYIGHFDDKVAAAVVFANLNADDRTLLHQHFYEDKTVQELAAERGIPWTTMRSRLDGVIHRARTIMDDKSLRRRGIGATAVMLVALYVSEFRARMRAWWSRSERAVSAGLLGFLAGGTLVAVLLHSAVVARLSFVTSPTRITGEAHAAALFASDSPQRTPAAPSRLPSGFVGCVASASTVSSVSTVANPVVAGPPVADSPVASPNVPVAAPKVRPQANQGTVVVVEERSRVILPWGISAVIRDDDNKQAKAGMRR